MVPDYLALIEAKNASFFGDLGDPVRYLGGNDSENEACLAAIRGQKGGLPDWWWVGRDFPRVSRKSRTNHWALTVPDYLGLIAAKNAAFWRF